MSFKLLVTIVNCNRVNVYQSRFVQSKNAMNVRWSRKSIVNFFYLPGAVLIVGDLSLSAKGEKPIVRRRRIPVVALESLRRPPPDVAAVRPRVGPIRRRIGVVRCGSPPNEIGDDFARNGEKKPLFPSCRFHTPFQSHQDLFGSSWAPFPANLQLSTPAYPLP